MSPREAHDALRELAKTSPKWIGSRVDTQRNVFVRKCMRCGAQEEKPFPPGMRGPQDVPPGFDESLFAWMKEFAVKHRDCSAPDPSEAA